MKKIFIILIGFVVLFSACETDVDVNAEWKETTVVYGLLDANADTQYIKINRAYLGEGDAEMMAQYSDSINFNPDELDVRLHKMSSNDTLASVPLDTVLLEKQDGLFSSDNKIVYTVANNDDFFSDDYRYILTIKNKKSGNKVYAETEVIDNFSFYNFNTGFKIGFYNPGQPDSLKFLSKTMEWQKVKNGEIYQLDIKFNYTENGVAKYLVWSQPLEVFSGASFMQSKLEGVRFFNFLRQNLVKDNSVVRQFMDIELVMTVGTENLNTYIRLNLPITGIVQQRPQFTNIDNGIGIFSSRYIYVEDPIDLTNDTRLYLIDELDRNFQ